jgi:hypothetical protein
MSLKHHIEMRSNNTEDESDSNLLMHSNRRPVQIETDNNNAQQMLTKINPFKKEQLPPLITQKAAAPLVQVRPVVAAVAAVRSASQKSPNRHRIDKIVDNLKINILQKEVKKPVVAPKVSLVSVAQSKLKDSPNKLNQTTATAMDRKKLAQKFHNIILKNLEISIAKEQEKENESSSDEELSNLNWLTKFNLASTGIKPISPPHTPPRQVSSAQASLHTKLPSAKLLAPLLTKPIVNPYIKKSAPNLNLAGDEADGCYSPSGRKHQQVMSSVDLASIIKPWLAEHVANPHQRPPYSFSCLTVMAIESSARKRLSVKEIYSWVTENLPYYRSVPSGSWKNSIRHNLSCNPCFCKVDKNLLAMRDFSGKGSLWCVNPENRVVLMNALIKEPSGSGLGSLSFLQDVVETQRVVSTISNTSGEESTSPNKSMTSSSNLNSSVRVGLMPINATKKKFNLNQVASMGQNFKNSGNKM